MLSSLVINAQGARRHAGQTRDAASEGAGADLLLHPLLRVNGGGLGLAQHQPVLVGVLRHLLAAVIDRLHLRVAAKDLSDTFLPGSQNHGSKGQPQL